MQAVVEVDVSRGLFYYNGRSDGELSDVLRQFYSDVRGRSLDGGEYGGYTRPFGGTRQVLAAGCYCGRVDGVREGVVSPVGGHDVGDAGKNGSESFGDSHVGGSGVVDGVNEQGQGGRQGESDVPGDDLGVVGSEAVSGVEKEKKKKDRKEKNLRRKANKRAAKGPGSCESGVGPVPVWRRGALSETVSGFSADGGRGYFAEIDKAERISLRESRARMLVRQNELAMLRAEREVKVLEATDIEVEKRKYLTSVRAATERNMVSIEKTHAQLAATDNVPRSELDHDVHTVLTGDVPGLSSGSISPNSSASMAEFRACQKENLDLKSANERMVEAFKKLGMSETTIPFIGKKDWTINSQGTLDDAAHAALDELMPGGYALDGQQYAEKGDKVGVMPLGRWGY